MAALSRGIAEDASYDSSSDEVPADGDYTLFRKISRNFTQSAADETLSQINDAEHCYHSFQPDAWGALMLVVIHDFPHLLRGTIKCANVCRLAFTLVMSVLCGLIQVVLVRYIEYYVQDAQILEMQEHYKLFHASVFDRQRVFQQHLWDATDDDYKSSLCQAGLAHPMFTGTLTLVWTLRMLQELRETWRMFRHARQLPDLPHDSFLHQMIRKKQDDDTGDIVYDIVCLDPIVRCFIYSVVIVPKAGIALFLLVAGTRWLAATESFEDLILNCLALEFVVNIDELSFIALWPESMLEELEQTRLAVPRTVFTVADKNWTMVRDYLRSSFAAVASLSWVCVYIFYMQDILPGYDGDLKRVCHQYFEQEEAGICTSSLDACFPYGAASG
eukprot:TRINITY_DN61528_c0_g1_i1.p1 TRINITY_DN61528_c0_g1~~TRINITY_DN61528_c0_g1_i1.p1  ORF type:complete len:387 (+),score=44.13 TRINITY_DN61528_c0_g1_i1:46-1206(+)